MSALLEVLTGAREIVKPEWRERIYDTVGAAVVVLGGWGLVDEADAAVYVQVILSCVALLFAILHSTSNIRTAVYGLLGAVQALAAFYSIGTDAQWAGVLAMAAAVLGTQVAAGRTPILGTLLATVGRLNVAPGQDLGEVLEDMQAYQEQRKGGGISLDEVFEDPVAHARRVLDTKRRDALPDPPPPPPPPPPPAPGQGAR